MPLFNLVVLLLVIVGICWFTKWIVGYMGVPHPFSLIILVAVALICLYVLLVNLGVTGGGGPVIRLR